MNWKPWTTAGVLTAACFLAILPSTTADHDPFEDDCSLDEVDWGAFAYDTESGLGTRLERTIALTDTERLDCGPDVYREAIRQIVFHFFSNPCAVVDASGLHPNDVNHADGLAELNWQAETGDIFRQLDHLSVGTQLPQSAGEGHLYLNDDTCGFETLLLLAASPVTKTAIIGIGAENGSPDRAILTTFAYKKDGFVGANDHAVAQAPSCGTVKLLHNPVDPTWGAGQFFVPSPADVGSPWAVAPYGPLVNAPEVNTDGNCLLGDWEEIVEVGPVFMTVVAVPGAADVPSWGTVDKYEFKPLEGSPASAVLPCVVWRLGASTVDPCAAAGATNVGTFFTLVAPDQTVPSPLTTVTFHLCASEVTSLAFGFGVKNVPAATPCYA